VSVVAVPAVSVTAGGFPAPSVLARLVRCDEAEALVVAAPCDSSCASHPDILEFIRAEALEEGRGCRRGQRGLPAPPMPRALAFQQANHAVRVTDEFMRMVLRTPRGSCAP
jgi:hypothetical protein